MNSSLHARAVKIRANDFATQDLSAHVVLTDEANGKILMELDVLLNVAGVLYKHAIASPRLTKDSWADFLSEGVLGSAVTWIPVEKFDSDRPLDISWWRGGAAAVTDIYLD